MKSKLFFSFVPFILYLFALSYSPIFTPPVLANGAVPSGRACIGDEPAISGICRRMAIAGDQCAPGEIDAGTGTCADALLEGLSPESCCVHASGAGGGAGGGPMGTYIPLEKIPGASDAKTFPQYIQGIYKFGIWTVGLAALFMLSVGGFIYLSSGGNTTTISKAKTYIWDALIGLVLALLAYLILYVINPDLVNVNLASFSRVGGSVPENGIQAPSAPGVPAKYTDSQCRNKPTPDGYFANNSEACNSGDASIGDFVNDTGVVTGVCCASKITAAQCKAGVSCASCIGCVAIPETIPIKTAGLGACYGGDCFLNSALLEKVKKISEGGWQVTEAWPPTVSHKSKGHQDGSCVDLNSTSGATDTVTIKNYYDKFNAAGLHVLFETPDCSSYKAAEVTNCSDKNKSISPHFHSCI